MPYSTGFYASSSYHATPVSALSIFSIFISRIRSSPSSNYADNAFGLNSLKLLMGKMISLLLLLAAFAYVQNLSMILFCLTSLNLLPVSILNTPGLLIYYALKAQTIHSSSTHDFSMLIISSISQLSISNSPSFSQKIYHLSSSLLFIFSEIKTFVLIFQLNFRVSNPEINLFTASI